MDTQTIIAIVISGASLVVALISFVMNYSLRRREEKQNKQLANLQLKLHEIQLRKEEVAAVKQASSKIEARHVSLGARNHKLRISNTGGATVTDITCEVDEENGPYALVQNKEPYERLEPGESFDEPMVMASGTPPKFTITTHWIDPDGKKCSRENIISW